MGNFSSNQYDKVRNSSEEGPAEERRNEDSSADLTNHTYKSGFIDKYLYLNSLLINIWQRVGFVLQDNFKRMHSKVVFTTLLK